MMKRYLSFAAFLFFVDHCAAHAVDCASTLVGSCSHEDAPELCIDLPANAPFAQDFAVNCDEIDGVYAPTPCAGRGPGILSCALPSMSLPQRGFTGSILRFYLPATHLQATRMCQEYGAAICE